jgi:virulence-associated protein VagC
MKATAAQKTTTVFKNGTSIAVRLPKGYTLPIGRVVITKNANGNIELIAANNGWPEDLRTRFMEPVEWETPKKLKSKRPQSWA